MPDLADSRRVLQEVWGYPGFRPGQEEIIASVLSGKDTLALLPTGGGKSICFQVPGMVIEGLTLVISPLIALMKDQVERLNRLGIPATFVNSSLNPFEVDRKLQGAMDGTYKFLYLAPERISSDIFQMRLPNMPVKLLVVDEAHCISQWGYDFRPAYLRIGEIRANLPQVPVIALTASATPRVQEDIQEKLEMQEPQVFRQSFFRPNLRYFVLEEENVAERILRICQRTQGTGIIYSRTRKTVEKLADYLKGQGIRAIAYHGGLKNSLRNQIQQAWLENQHRVIVATNAFGMGIDKPDVRFVLHYNLPFDLESYYQEAGRGGRDGQTALAIAFKHGPDEADLKRWAGQKYPSWEQLTRHYEILCEAYQLTAGEARDKLVEFDLQDLLTRSGDSRLAWYNSLRVLDAEGIISFQEDSDDFGYVQFIARPEDILRYKDQHPSFAAFIDFMLRTLGGESYTREVRFLPDQWARQLDIPPLDLHYYLERLAQHRLIAYTPPSHQPGIKFLMPRHKLSKQGLNWDKYTFLQEQSQSRLADMLGYVHNTHMCRSLIIQQYFGEAATEPCGKCDICIGRHKTKVNDSDFREIKAQILAYVKAHEASYRDILLHVAAGKPAQREKVLRYLLDREIIQRNPTGKLSLSA
ncbi:MAG: ATP-dependent DNA helicase RecQ [Bacteroidota bacterium]